MTFNDILDKYRKISHSERDKGDRFERLIQAYFQTDPLYAYRLKKVWLWNDFPGKKEFGGKDTGIVIINSFCDYGMLAGTQCFPLYYYEENNNHQKTLFDS